MICLGFTSSSSYSQSSCSLVQTCDTSKVTATALEEAIRAHIDDEEEDIEIFESDDAVLLHCRLVDDDEQSILGMAGDNGVVHVTKLEPCIDSFRAHECCCDHPRRDWTRKTLEVNSSSSPAKKELLIVDMTKLQFQRRHENNVYPSFDTPGKVFHLLRSILTCENGLHCASPWYHSSSSSCSHDKTVALLIKSPTKSDYDFWDELEERELTELVNFRTGDAAPSYYLYSTINMRAERRDSHQPSNDLTMTKQLFQNDARFNTVLLVFKHLPPRDVLTAMEPEHMDCNCNLEMMQRGNYVGCMWQKYVRIQSKPESDEASPKKASQKTTMHRMISPPYLSHDQEYPGLLDAIISNIEQIRDEALKIPQWTAWPERNHYSSSTNDEDGPYAAWTVFPLCHTFPANDVSRRKYIETTCSFVPKTAALLQSIGPKLRTALFSRLDKQTTLGTHTGWSDLANHVLRVHIPLVVPAGDSCGTWVDGW